ncbi:MAG: hypothetical protein ACTS4T_00745 [Candidatus Hodgkinia cicadicola]
MLNAAYSPPPLLSCMLRGEFNDHLGRRMLSSEVRWVVRKLNGGPNCFGLSTERF